MDKPTVRCASSCEKRTVAVAGSTRAGGRQALKRARALEAHADPREDGERALVHERDLALAHQVVCNRVCEPPGDGATDLSVDSASATCMLINQLVSQTIATTIPDTVADQGAAGTSETMVEPDAGGQAEKARQDPLAQAGQRTGAAGLQIQRALEAPDDRGEERG